ncbi:MAG: serpin family protein [Planctomycetes bacterium]|jgi:serpin B|nr:serpin family protein [Planctomycetota bacterium]
MKNAWIPSLLLATASMLAPMPAQTPTDAQRLATACNQFGADLHAELARAGNPTASPTSIALALLLLAPGARGATLDELATVLHLPADLRGERLHAAVHELLQASGLAPAGKVDPEAPMLRLRNDLWSQTGHRLVPDYLQALRGSMLAVSHELDFRGDAETARQHINAHIAEATNGRISELLPNGVLDATTQLVLTNALWLKGQWQHAFTKGRTADAPFHMTAEVTVPVPTMHVTDQFRFAETSQWQVVVLPFAASQLQCEIIVPKAGHELAAAERAMLAGEPRAALQWNDVHVQLPRFRTTARHRLKQPLQALGLRAAFDGGLADFRGIDAAGGLLVDEVVHQTFVQVDEDGAEAAAATAVVVAPTSAAPRQQKPLKQFVADRPFAFVLRDGRTGLVLFAGRVEDPRENAAAR